MSKQRGNKILYHGSQLTLLLCILLGSDLKGCDEVIILDPALRVTPTPTATDTTTTTTSVSTSSTSSTSSTTTTTEVSTTEESTEDLRIFNAFGSNEELEDEDSDEDNDSDLDDLSDEDETEAKTSRVNPDSDGDGWTDGAEVTQGYDPKSPSSHPPINQAIARSNLPLLSDLDNDALPDILEKELHSNLNNPDTDGDNQMDGLEVLNSSNPNDENSKILQDSDQDGLSDQLEQQFKTNSQNPDSDNDRLIDSLELLYNLDPKNPDTNGDGIIDSAQPGAKDFRFSNKEFHF